VELLLGTELRGSGERCISNFVESIGAVEDDFSRVELLVGVEGL
jgi:hypothetical protein